MKQCNQCKQLLPLDHYHRRKKSADGLQTKCKACKVVFTREFKKKHPERYRLMTRRKDLKRAYGISPDRVREILTEQGFVCAICEVPISDEVVLGEKVSANIDHCHTTGAVRGLLCSLCNLGLGKFRDNRTYLRNAIAYLDKHHGVQ